MSHFLVGLVLVSQLFAGAKDCPGRRDDCEETTTSANHAQVIIDAACEIKSIVI